MLTKFIAYYSAGEGFTFSKDKIKEIKQFLPKHFELVEIKTKDGIEYGCMSTKWNQTHIDIFKEGTKVTVFRDRYGNINGICVPQGNNVYLDENEYPEIKQQLENKHKNTPVATECVAEWA